MGRQYFPDNTSPPPMVRQLQLQFLVQCTRPASRPRYRSAQHSGNKCAQLLGTVLASPEHSMSNCARLRRRCLFARWLRKQRDETEKAMPCRSSGKRTSTAALATTPSSHALSACMVLAQPSCWRISRSIGTTFPSPSHLAAHAASAKTGMYGQGVPRRRG